MKNFIKNFYAIVNVPDTVNVATPQAIEFVPGATVTKGANGAGALTITTPEPP
jgi:hypothetical protein